MSRVAVLGIVAVGVVVGWLGVLALHQGNPLEAQADEPLAGYSILVEIDGIAEPYYRGCEGLSIQTQVIEFRDAGNPNSVQKIPGVTSWGDLVLKFGPGPLANALWEWHTTVLDGAVDKRNLSVILLNPKREEIVRYNILNAWPCKWEGARQVASNTAIPIESITLASERITRFGH